MIVSYDAAMPMERVAVFTDPQMTAHMAHDGHPESPGRLQTLLDDLDANASPWIERRTPEPIDPALLELAHTRAHVASMLALRGNRRRIDIDTAVTERSIEAALLAAGAAVEAARCVMHGDFRRAFALVRPPGHHAERDRAMGFCLFNNIAVAAAVARAQLGCERIMIVDFDVHHGNGTQHIFEDRADVLFFSSHRTDIFPGTGQLSEYGRGEGVGFTINVPLPAGADDAHVCAVYRSLVPEIASEFKPNLVLVSAGFDAHERDPLGGLRMTVDGFAALCGLLRDIADKHSGGPIALVLEGGYDLDALRSSVRACMEVLAGADPPAVASGNAPEADRIIARVRNHRASLSPR